MPERQEQASFSHDSHIAHTRRRWCPEHVASAEEPQALTCMQLRILSWSTDQFCSTSIRVRGQDPGCESPCHPCGARAWARSPPAFHRVRSRVRWKAHGHGTGPAHPKGTGPPMGRGSKRGSDMGNFVFNTVPRIALQWRSNRCLGEVWGRGASGGASFWSRTPACTAPDSSTPRKHPSTPRALASRSSMT